MTLAEAHLKEQIVRKSIGFLTSRVTSLSARSRYPIETPRLMPGLNGFEVVQALTPEVLPLIVSSLTTRGAATFTETEL